MKAKTAKKQLTCKQVMKKLKDAGTAQMVKMYTRHGATGDIYGVSYANLKAFDKEIEGSQELAEELWATGNLDARIFACWKADETKATVKSINAWARDMRDDMLIYEMAAFVAFTDLGAKISRKWRPMANERRSAMGWRILATLAMQPDRTEAEGGVSDQELLDCLKVIEAEIHTAKNSTKENMNVALRHIGCRQATSKAALAAAKRIGEIDVDHGDTSCKTIYAYTWIKDTLAKYKAKGKLPTDGAGGKRRRHC